MSLFTIILWLLLSVSIIYFFATMFVFFWLKSKLGNANLDKFKSRLGTNYFYKQQLNGWTKYKWLLGLMSIRASFDEQGNLMEYEIKPYRFFPGSYKKSFS